MTEPVRLLEALIDKIFVAGQMDAQGHAAEKFKIGSGGTALAFSRSFLKEAREEIAALLQAAAPPAPTAEPSGLIGRGESTPMSDEEASAVPDSAHGSVTVNDFVCAVGEMTNEDALHRVKELAAAAPSAPTAEQEYYERPEYVTANDLLLHIQHGHSPFNCADYIQCSCGTTFWFPGKAAPPERVSEGKG